MTNSKTKRVLVCLSTFIVVLIVVAVIALFPEPAIPRSITKRVGYRIAQPSGSYEIKKGSANYISQSGVLTFTAEQKSSTPSYTVSEQAIPDAFHDSEQVYPALLNKMHEYAQINTSQGTVALTHPQELNGGQSAVLDTNSTLIFVRPNVALSQKQWKDFFNSLEWQ